MGRGKFKGKPTGQRHFSTPEQMLAGTSTRPRTFKRQKRKGTQGIIEIENPNLVKAKNLKARDADVSFCFYVFLVIVLDLEVMLLLFGVFRLGKHQSFQGVKERLSLIRQQREEAARKRDEEKAAKEQKKSEARK
ncbi:hypothetical protein SADUNF_Sadunf11G0038300 [Salix dunnii]|uniref:Uncharacterized protein n=1 Tax=Salix dunnii TaxID=1413687 RepID=A0A835JK44_9ROSI|nr:hypothetical protein SADUNF_Sadunf11G0038300 [Salix dunnii]